MEKSQCFKSTNVSVESITNDYLMQCVVYYKIKVNTKSIIKLYHKTNYYVIYTNDLNFIKFINHLIFERCENEDLVNLNELSNTDNLNVND